MTYSDPSAHSEVMPIKTHAVGNESMMRLFLAQIASKIRHYARLIDLQIDVSSDITDRISVTVTARKFQLELLPDTLGGTLFFAFRSEALATVRPMANPIYRYGSISPTLSDGKFNILRIDQGCGEPLIQDESQGASLNTNELARRFLEVLLYGAR